MTIGNEEYMAERAAAKAKLVAYNDRALKSIIASTNPTGVYAAEVIWAKEELTRRNVDFSDCLSKE